MNVRRTPLSYLFCRLHKEYAYIQRMKKSTQGQPKECCEQRNREEMIDIIKSMQERQGALLSDIMSKPDSFKKLFSNLHNLVSQEELKGSPLSAVNEIKELLNTFKDNALRQLRTQQELLELKSASLEAVLANVDVCIIQLDEQGLILEFNTLADDLFTQLFDQQITRNHSLGQYFKDEDLALRCKKNINYALMGKNTQLSEIIRREEKSSILKFRFSPIWHQDNIKGVTIIAEDMTRKHQEESLYRLLNSAVIYANDAILVTEVGTNSKPESSIVYVNRAFCKLSGYAEEELIGNSPRMLQGNETDDAELRKLKESMNAGQSVRTEQINYRKDGSSYWVNLSIVPLKDENGRVTHWISIQRDMSDRRKAEETIREQKNYLESIYHNTSEAIVCADPQKRPRFTNQAFRELFQYEKDDITLDDLFADKASLQIFNEKLYEQGKISNMPFLFKKKDGTTFWGLTSFTINDYDGKRKIDGAIRDISDLKAAEQVLQEKNKALEKTNEELDRFVYSASHDLRAPLASSLGLINISRISTDETEKHTYLDMMEQSLNKMDKTIQDITDNQRNARLQIETEEIHFENMIDDVLQRLKYLKHIDEVKINTNIRGEAKFFTDKIRLYVILINLISNAVKFIRFDISNPYINIFITITQEKARILVEDNGIGIAPVDLDKIFGMFFQAARESSGSGLGLYIVKETINKLNGSIKVRSKVNEGASFELILPNENKTLTKQNDGQA